MFLISLTTTDVVLLPADTHKVDCKDSTITNTTFM